MPNIDSEHGNRRPQCSVSFELTRNRKLTPKECFQFQGFPEKFVLPKTMSNSHLYKQAGNSVSVPVIERIATSILKALEEGEKA